MSSREIKKTEAGREYQTDVLSKEYKRLKKNVAKQLNRCEQQILSGKAENVRSEIDKLNNILAELHNVSHRLEQLVTAEEANKIKEEVELEGKNAAKVVEAMNDWLEAHMTYSFPDTHRSPFVKMHHNLANDKLSTRSAPCLQYSDQRTSASVANSLLMNSLKRKMRRERHTLSERSFRGEEDATQKEGKSSLRKFQEELLEEMDEIGRRILIEISMIRITVSDFASEGLRDRLHNIENLKRRRENPAMILFKIMNDGEASRLAEKMSTEDSQIEEIRSIVHEVENLEQGATQSTKGAPLVKKSSMQNEIDRECIALKQGVDEVKSVVKRMRKQQSEMAERQSNRSIRSEVSSRSGALSDFSRASDDLRQKYDKNDGSNKIDTLKRDFDRHHKELEDLKNSCLAEGEPILMTKSNEKLLEMDNAFNLLKETGRRLREHLSSTEAEEIKLKIYEEDEEVFEVKQKVIKKISQKKDKHAGSPNDQCNHENGKCAPEKKKEDNENDEKRSLEHEVSTMKVRLDNQKKLVHDILSTNDIEMIRREVHTLDRRYDEYVAAEEQVRCVSSTDEMRRISKLIAEEDNQVFQLKTLATKFISASKSNEVEDVRLSEIEDDRLEENVVEQLPASKMNLTAEAEESSLNLLKLNELMIQTIKLQSAPGVEIEAFKGDPLEYYYFMENFQDAVENLVDNPKQRLVRLLKYTEGDAKELIKHCVHEDAEICYKEALRLLEKEYGNPLRMSCAYLEKLKNWPPIKTNEIGALKCLYRFLLRCLAFKKKGNIDLDSPLTIRCVQLALPVNMQDGWTAKAGKIRRKNKTEAGFSDMVEFIDDWCQRLSDPVYARVKNKEIKILKTELKEKCPVCTLQHDMDDCPTFSSKTVREKKDFLFKARMCFCCYGRNHAASKCENKRTCRTCSKEHPTALHDVTFKTLAVRQKRGSATCIVPIRLRHETWKDKEIEVYALLDECSDGTFISESILHKFEDELKRNTTVEVDTINLKSEREAIAMKNLIVRGSEELERVYGLEEIKLPETFSQARIPMDEDDVLTANDLKRWEYLKEVAACTLPVAKDIPFGLLIGNNCPKALEPLKVIASRDNGPYATRSRLGWYVSAPREEEKKRFLKCSNIKVIENQVKDTSICKALEEMWREDFTEKASEKKTLSKEDRVFLEVMKNSISMLNGHYVLPLPLRKDTFKPQEKEERVQSDHEHRIRHARESHKMMQDKKLISTGEEVKETESYKLNPSVKIISPNEEVSACRETEYVTMPINRGQILYRLKSIKRKMLQDKKLKDDYCDFMNKILKAGYARKVPKESLNQRAWYIPHHGVYHPTKKKFRVVLDCSAEKDGVSLNSVLMQGPDFTNSLIGILMNFRTGKIPVMADIESMYHQVMVPEEHRKFLRFFWWEDGNLESEPQEHEMCVHPFGAISSKSCVTFALHQTAFDNEKEIGKEAMEALIKNFYIDDMLKSWELIAEAIQGISSVDDMCRAGGFNLTKFVSTNNEVINSIPLEKRAKGLKTLHKFGKSPTVESALGIQWHLLKDEFGFKVNLEHSDNTRRGCLTTLSRIHDPAGWGCVFLLPGRKILQKTAHTSFGWDDQLPPETLKKWVEWRNEIAILNELRIKRCYRSSDFGNLVDMTLHCFSDASFVGYGVACYLRLVDESGRVEVPLVMGKARVSPMKPTTVPRLELTAATLSVQIAAMLVEELQLQDVKVYFWIDNRVVLGYIYNEKRRYRIYVANRVQIIDKYSKKEQWKYVDTKDNPSDFASRGISPLDGEKVDIWLNGPHFLRKNDDWWKDQQPEVLVKEDDREVKAAKKVNVIQLKERTVLDVLEDRISNWNKMIRVIVWIQRYASKEWMEHRSKLITVEESQKAESNIIRMMQQRAYGKEMDKMTTGGKKKGRMESLKKLNPFIDQEGVMRVGGRLANSQEDDRDKFPIIIPKNSKATTAMIRWHHAKIEHRGKHFTISRIRSAGYWVINGNKEVGSVVYKCVRCLWLRGKCSNQKMADLPYNRTEAAPPFTYCGVDIFGPILVKEGRKTVKRYGVLFTCLSLRAVHIELAASLETDSFIQSLCRFVARRGAVREVRSDNGTNFVGAENELLKAYEEMDHQKIGNFLTTQGCDYIKWERNTPHASHMGGVWERQIRTVKSVIQSLLKSSPRRLDEESLRTFLTEAEGIVNSRPLTLEDLNNPEIEPISPNQILTMKTRVAPPPPGVFQQEGVYARKRWRVVQHMANSFWSRWRKEYLQLQQSRQKWTETKRNLKVNDIVLVKDESAPRGQWPMGRVIEIHESSDGLVRSVSLFAKGTIYKRPIHKTVLLVASDEPKLGTEFEQGSVPK